MRSLIIALALLLTVVACERTTTTRVTQFKALKINTIDGPYTMGTPVEGGRKNAIDLVKIATSQTVKATDLPYIDGFILSDATAASLSLTINISYYH